MSLFTECLEASQVDSLLHGNLTPEEYEAAQNHLEQCETCRAGIESTIGPQQWWNDVQSVLLNTRTRASMPRNAFSADVEPNDRSTAKLLDLLGPTDDPNMLGRIGPYEIIGLLGQGGMGAVFKGFDRSLNRFVAIKMLLPHLAASGAARKRFAREGQAVAAVVDDHVMAIHCVDEWQGVPYLVMTYSRGVALQKRLSDNGPLEVREILRIGMQAAKGLAAAHAQGIVHRDIKPANIFLDQNVERVQLMDFGLARAVDDASLTRTGVLAGTPQYMSPEQARAETVDHRSDLFSLGSVMYAMCTGNAPFRAESSYSVLRLITDKEPRPIREINPDVPEWLCAIITKLMAKQASERYQSAKEVSELLEDCLAHVQQPATMPLPEAVAALAPIMSHRPPIGKLIAAAAFAFALLFAGLFIVLELNKGTLTIQSDADDVRIRITSGDDVIDELKVSKLGQSVRIAAGKYNVEIIGENDELTVENGQVTLHRAGTEVVRIVHGARNQTENQTSFAPGAGPGRTTSKSLLDKLQGRWHVVEHYYLGGNPKRRLCSAIVRGNRVEISPGYGPRPLKIDLIMGELGPPQQIDLKFANNELERQEMLENGGGINEPPSEPVLNGIIEVDGDLITICSSSSSDSPHRPTAFISSEEQILWNFTRAVEPSATNLSPSTSSSESSTKYFLTLKFYEKREDSIKHLANPTIVVNAGTPFTYIAGGVINEIDSGFRLDGTVGSLDDGTVQASLQIGNNQKNLKSMQS